MRVFGAWKRTAPCDSGNCFHLSGGFDRVGHQHGNRHGTHATGHRGDGSRFLCNLVESHIAHQTITARGRSVFHSIDPHVDDYGALAHLIGFHKLRAADGAIWERSRLRECTTVTVALAFCFFCISSRASGLPTIILRPSTTTWAPAICTRLSTSKRCTPRGVHGTKPLASSRTSFATLSG